MINPQSARAKFRRGDEVVLTSGTFQDAARSPRTHELTRHTVPDAIAVGSILVEESIHLPSSLLLQRESHCSGWSELTNPRSAFEKELQAAGWTHFFMAGEVKATVFGFDKHKTLGVALKRLITNVKAQNCNSIEITQVTYKSFLKVPYVSVSAHARHIQKGLFFSGPR